MKRPFSRLARLSPQALRLAKPARNPAVEETVEAGVTILRGPAVLKGLLGKLVARASSQPVIRQFELEEIGAFVWSLIDGRRNFDALSKQLQRKYKMNPAEADASLAAFLKMLADRGLITLLVKDVLS
ncbi:MAG TPA: PqqD family protein [Fimbriimonadaceae bacterium]|nr:PqqD family protein [Fimbriimonadaceae bacterium]